LWLLIQCKLLCSYRCHSSIICNHNLPNVYLLTFLATPKSRATRKIVIQRMITQLFTETAQTMQKAKTLACIELIHGLERKTYQMHDIPLKFNLNPSQWGFIDPLIGLCTRCNNFNFTTTV